MQQDASRLARILKGRWPSVTGASRGIGQAIALALGQAGATVIGTATSERPRRAISDYLAAGQHQGQRDESSTSPTPRGRVPSSPAISAQFGDIGHPGHNAGITRDNLLMRMKERGVGRHILAPTHSVFPPVTCGACARMMKAAAAASFPSLGGGAMGNAGQTILQRGQGRHHGLHQVAGARSRSRNIR